MRTYYNVTLIVISAFLLSSCDRMFGTSYNTGSFPETPVNMEEFNSEYDDYNSTSPVLGGSSPLCFSSNRESQGENFNIVYKLLNVFHHKSDGKLEVSKNTNGNLDVYSDNAHLRLALNKINTGSDEFGPYLIPQGYKADPNKENTNYQSYIFLFSNNESGSQDIQYLHSLETTFYSEPKTIPFLNSDKDDAYPTFTEDFASLYFCSNRDQQFDIYVAELNTHEDILASLEDSSAKSIQKEEVLSSEYDDKCPFIIENLMVFSSNRPEGYGGFDLYYSIFANGSWSAPVNFGDKVNTAYDEYRPIVKPMDEFTNDFMIFSSDRPEGKGGFDLYFVGIDELRTN